MLEQDYIAKILNLEDIVVTNVEASLGELHLYVELPQKEHECPQCGKKTSVVHDYRMQVIKDNAPKLLSNWLILAEHYNIKEFDACIKAYHNWDAEILNAIRFPWSNGFTEGCNNKTKVLKRVSFGVRNFSRFRNRILHCA